MGGPASLCFDSQLSQTWRTVYEALSPCAPADGESGRKSKRTLAADTFCVPPVSVCTVVHFKGQRG